MKYLLNQLKVAFTSSFNKQSKVVCNYTDNYYGDQCCQSKSE
ncbi:MAG: hypothetical protein ACPG46_07420 [Thalassotalea sp.]